MPDVNFSWSYSAYSKALECFHCFKKAYLDKEKPEGPESGDLLFGSAMHSAWNALLTGQDAPGVFDLYWGSYAQADVEYGRLGYEELGRMGQEFLRKFKKNHAERFQIERHEERLYAEYQGIPLEGQFDYWGLFDGKLALLDLKTSGYNYPKTKKAVALQLNLYAYLALQNGFKTPELLGYVVLNKGTGSIQEPLVWEFNSDTMYKMLDEMVTYCGIFNKMIKAGQFPRNPNAFRHSFNCYKEVEYDSVSLEV